MQRVIELLNRDVFQPLRFLIVGGAATAVHMLVAVLLFFLNSDLSTYLINVCAFLVAFVVSFLGHRYITFKTSGSVWRFFIVAIGGFLANNAILTLCLWAGMGELISLMVAVVSVPLLTYISSSLWAFKRKE